MWNIWTVATLVGTWPQNIELKYFLINKGRCTKLPFMKPWSKKYIGNHITDKNDFVVFGNYDETNTY